MEFIPEELKNYIEYFSSPEPELLKDLSRETYSKILMPRMLSGHYQGRLLSMISKMVRPHRILEVGTYTGYSALCLAEGLSEDGRLITIDINDELRPMVDRYILRSDYASQIQLINGNAAEIIPKLTEQFDLAFIDADKANYCLYFDLIIDKMKPGGIILADNVLWSGKVLDTKKADKDTTALMEFNKKVHLDPRTETVILPVRDGINIIRKIH